MKKFIIGTLIWVMCGFTSLKLNAVMRPEQPVSLFIVGLTVSFGPMSFIPTIILFLNSDTMNKCVMNCK